MFDTDVQDAQLDSSVSSPRRTSKRGAGRTKPRSSPKPQHSPTASGSLDTMLDTNDGGAGGGMHSLAHELAAALMPEPSPGSKPLADELGLEFEEGAEGIDELPEANGLVATEDDEDEDGEQPLTPTSDQHPHQLSVLSQEENEQRSWDPLADLSNDMQTMDIFVSHLRRLDGEYASTSEPVLEKAASQLIRRLNEAVRERENQVRQLLELEREFRRISGEIGGDDVLGSLDELEAVEGLLEYRQPFAPRPTHSRLPSLNEADEDEWERASSIDQSHSAQEIDGSLLTPISPSYPSSGYTTPSSTIPHVARFRSETKSLASSLTSLSEQTQVNGAATADAGRKIRALKNKVSAWQAETESADRSRERIASWERSNRLSRRTSGRDLVEEQLNGFKLSLEEAATKADAIMAAT